MKKLIAWLKAPRGWGLAIVYLITAAFLAATVLSRAFLPDKGVFVYLTYLIILLAVGSLSYSVYTVVYSLRGVLQDKEKYPALNRFFSDFDFRTVVFSLGSLFITLVFAAFHLLLALLEESIWYFALAGYYGILSLIRGGVLLNYIYGKRKHFSRERQEKREAKVYRVCGELLVLLTLALSVAVAQVIYEDKIIRYASLSIYGVALYVTVKTVFAVINLFKARKRESLSVKALRQINFADNLVSIFALQVAMLATFSTEGIDKTLFNSIIGGLICLSVVAMGIRMIYTANRELKQFQTSQTNPKNDNR